MNKLADIYMPVMKNAQRLGLVVPCLVNTWDNWWQETTMNTYPRLSIIRLGQGLLNPFSRIWVLNQYREHGGRTTASGLFAHELGHAFRHFWIRNRKVAPLAGYGKVFGRHFRFADPWNDMEDYLAEHPDFELDTDRFLSWYAWSDHEEDFCECFAELVLAGGDLRPYNRHRGIYAKMNFIRRAGQKILVHNSALRDCIQRGQVWLSSGEISFKCPVSGQKYGVPDARGSYLCPCGTAVKHDGQWIIHEQQRNSQRQ